MKDYDVYLFDFDGTLFDTLESLYPTFRYGLDAIGIHDVSDEEIESYTHMSLEDMMEMKNIPQGDRNLFVRKVIEALEMEETLKLIKPFPETVEVLLELKRRGKKLAVVSNNWNEHITRTLRVLNFPDVFDAVVGSDQVKRPKPYPDMLFEAFDRMGVVSAWNSVYVGDSLQDGETARAGGIGGIVVDRFNRYDEVCGEKCLTLRSLIE